MKKLLLLLLIATATFTYANEDYSDTASDESAVIEDSAPATDCTATGDCAQEATDSSSLDAADISDDSDLEVEQ